MHYKNGRDAKVGDLVVGKTYNTGGRTISGTLVSLTPGPDQCSAKVGYLETQVLKDVQPSAIAYTMSFVKMQGTEQHGSAGELAVTFYREDYTHCSNLLHADDVSV